MSIEEEILNNNRTVAVVGLSANPERPSYRVADYLKGNGYKIIPVNPTIEEALDEKSYADLSSIPEVVEVIKNLRPKGAKKFQMPSKCPECGNIVEHSEGCILCRVCGYSKCG